MFNKLSCMHKRQKNVDLNFSFGNKLATYYINSSYVQHELYCQIYHLLTKLSNNINIILFIEIHHYFKQ